MKVKYSVIPFVPAFLAMLFLKLMSVLGVDSNGEFLGMNSLNITYTVLGIAVGLFVVCILFNLLDRKTAPVYPVKKNTLAGLFAILTGLTILASSLSAVVTLLPDAATSERFLITVITAALAVPAGIAMMVMSKVHFTGESAVSSVSMLFVFPSLWGCANLVNEFLQATKVSISSKDLTGLFCYIFISLYLFSNSMVVSRIKGRNPVKGMFLYGLPMVALTLTYGCYQLVKIGIEGFNRDTVLSAAVMICLGLYALSFIMEVSSNFYTKDDLEIVESLTELEEDAFLNTDSPEFQHELASLGSTDQGAGDDILSVEDAQQQLDMVLDEDYITTPVESDAPEEYTAAGEELVFSETPADAPADDYISGSVDDLVFSEIPADDPGVPYADDYYSNSAATEDYIMGFDYEKEEGYDSSENKLFKKPLIKPAAEKPADEKSLKKLAREERKAAKKREAEEKRAAERAEKADRAERKAKAKMETPAPVPQPIKPAAEEPAAPPQAQPADAFVNNKTQNGARSAGATSADMERLSEELRRAAESRRSNEQAEKMRLADALSLSAALRAQQGQSSGADSIEEARAAEEARKAEEARIAEEARKAEEARIAAEEAKRAEEARIAAEIARREEEARRAAEEAQRAEEERKAAAQANPNPENIGTREEIYREKRSAVDEMLKNLGKKK